MFGIDGENDRLGLSESPRGANRAHGEELRAEVWTHVFLNTRRHALLVATSKITIQLVSGGSAEPNDSPPKVLASDIVPKLLKHLLQLLQLGLDLLHDDSAVGVGNPGKGQGAPSTLRKIQLDRTFQV